MGDIGVCEETKATVLSGTMLNVHGINVPIGTKGQEIQLSEPLRRDPGKK